MNMPISPLLEPEDLERMPGGEHYELVDGILVEKDVGAESGEVAVRLAVLLAPYIRQHKLGRTYDGQTGFSCFPGRPRLVRKPDCSFVAAARLPDGKSPKGDFTIAPDLAAEVITPSDKTRMSKQKSPSTGPPG